VSIIVQKFGGTSVANAEKILSAARRAIDLKHKGHQVVMVVSARGKKTDELIGLAEEITDKASPREMDMLLSIGEQESVALVAMAIHSLGEKAVSLTGGQIGIVTDSTHTKSRIRKISTERLRKHLNEGAIVVACGFQGVDEDGNITTLGRGGSDTTAAALAAALDAEECEIYTDVNGVYTTDPRVVPEARRIETISYDDMLEMASLGAGVMHSRSIEFAKKFNVKLRVKPAYSQEVGTLIAPVGDDADRPVTGLAIVKNEARVSLKGIPDKPGVMGTIFTKLAARKIPVDMVVQNVVSDGKAEVSFTVPEGDLAATLTASQEAVAELGTGTVVSGTNVAKVSAVGAGMRTNTGVAARMFRCLADEGINIQMITTSDIKISVLVDRDASKKALAAVHRGFELDKAGVGSGQWVVGSQTSRTSPSSLPTTNHPLPTSSLQAIADRISNMEDIVVSDILHDDAQSRVTIHNVQDRPGLCAEIFEGVAAGKFLVDMIVQNVGENGATEVSFTVPRGEIERCLSVVNDILKKLPGAYASFDRDISTLSVLGIGLRTHTGVGEKMFKALADAGINIKLINTSEIRMSAVVARDQGAKGLQALEKAFGV
jgi:aspartate kinase